MASPSETVDDFAFQQALNGFRSTLTAEEAQDFQLTTLGDLKDALAKLQDQQLSERKLRNLKRLQGFVLGMEQFERIVTVYQNTSEIVGFVWGPVKFLLLLTSSFTAAFDAVLGFYETIGLNLPQFQLYQTLFHTNPHVHTILHAIYADVLRFHKKALKLFKQKIWKQVFHATWKGFGVKLNRIRDSIHSNKLLLESQASLVQLTEHRQFVLEEQERYRRSKEDERRRKRIAVRDWLNAANTADDQEKYTEERSKYPETGKWIFHDTIMRSWRDSTNMSTPLMWLTGIPGAGKSILGSLLVEELRRSYPGCIVFFYCKHGDEERNSFIAVTRSLLGQLLTHNKALLPLLYTSVTESELSSLKSLSVAQSLLSVALRSLPRVFVILDGIDECAPVESRKIVAWFREEVESINNDSGDAHCLFISQDDQICNKLLKDIPTVKITKDNNKEDIRYYCTSLSQSWEDDFGISANKRRDVVESVVANASGMFLFARLVMHNLCSQLTKADFLRETSSNVFPKGLSEAYDRILSRILSSDNDALAQYARKLLGWLVSAKRSLKWHEIQGALSINLESQTIDFENRKLSVGSKHLLGSLVEVRSGGTLDLVHTTAKYYLLEKGHVLESIEAMSLCQLCLGYLGHPCVDSSLKKDLLQTYILRGYYVFLDYAVAHWASHLEDCLAHVKSYSPESFQSLTRLLEYFLDQRFRRDRRSLFSTRTQAKLKAFKGEKFHSRLVQAVDYWDNESTIGGIPSRFDPVLDLHLAVQTIRSEFEKLASQDSSLRELYGQGVFKCNRVYCKYFHQGFSESVLRNQHNEEHERRFLCEVNNCAASMVGFVSREDLDHHTFKVHRGPEESSFPVYQHPSSINVTHACKTGNIGAVERWVMQFTSDEMTKEAGFEDLINGKLERSSPIRVALDNERCSIVMLLLERTSVPAEHVCSVIKTACSEKKYAVVKSVMQIIISTDFSEKDIRELSRSIQTLLRRSCDILARELIGYACSRGSGIQPIWAIKASEVGCMDSLTYIISTVDGLAKARKNNSAIRAAARFGQAEACQILIDRGAYDMEGSKFDTVLQAAASNSHQDIVRMLILHGKPSAEAGERWLRVAQLRDAARGGKADIVEELLKDKDLAVRISDRTFSTPLFHAVSNGHLDAVSMLVSSGRDIGIDRPGRCWHHLLSHHGSWVTPLSMASLNGNNEIAKCLLRREDISIYTSSRMTICSIGKDWTALDIAEHLGHHEIADAIREAKAARKKESGDPRPQADSSTRPAQPRIHDGGTDAGQRTDFDPETPLSHLLFRVLAL